MDSLALKGFQSFCRGKKGLSSFGSITQKGETKCEERNNIPQLT